MLILAFEASGSALSAAVLSENNDASSVWEEARFGQARLVPLAVSVLAKAEKSFADITHVAAGCGPGSFTGIRVALAAAKGVCLAQDVPGLGISGLQALAHDVRAKAAGRMILAVADTRRGNLYAQIFTAEAAPVSEVFDVPDDQLLALLAPSIAGQEVIVVGYAASELVSLFSDYGYNAVSLSNLAATAVPTTLMIMIARWRPTILPTPHARPVTAIHSRSPFGAEKVRKTMIRPLQPADYDAILSPRHYRHLGV